MFDFFPLAAVLYILAAIFTLTGMFLIDEDIRNEGFATPRQMFIIIISFWVTAASFHGIAERRDPCPYERLEEYKDKLKENDIEIPKNPCKPKTDDLRRTERSVPFGV